MKKWLLYGLIAILGIAAIYGIAFSIITKVGEQTKLNEVEAKAQTQVADALHQSASQVEDARSTMTAAQSQVQAEGEKLAAQSQSTIEAVRLQAQATLTAADAESAAKIEMLKKAALCENSTSKIDYTDNASVSLSLKVWLESTVGKISERKWETVWYNSNTAIHTLIGKNRHVYIVYFNEPSLNLVRAVYNVSGMCWLDIH